MSIKETLKHVARFQTRDEQATDNQWHALWDARLIRSLMASRTWGLTRTGEVILHAFAPEEEQERKVQRDAKLEKLDEDFERFHRDEVD